MVWSKIAQVFSFGGQWGESTVRLVEGNDASAMLKKVEGILEDSMRVLSSHEPLLSRGEFNSFSVKHRKVVEVKQEVHDEQNRAAVPVGPAGNQPFRLDQEISRLYQQARIYHRDVITASRRAQANDELNFDEFQSADDRLQPSQVPESSDPATTWYSVITPSTGSLIDAHAHHLAPSEAGPDASNPTSRKPYLAVAHVRSNISGPNRSKQSIDSETYREILILESDEKTVIMFNPNRRHLSGDLSTSDETALLEMSRAGEALLQATNPQKLQGYEVIGGQHEMSWADSFVNTLSRLGVGIGADMM